MREALNELYKEKEQILEKYKQIKEQTTLLEEQLPKKKKENLAEKLNISENILLNKKKGLRNWTVDLWSYYRLHCVLGEAVLMIHV